MSTLKFICFITAFALLALSLAAAAAEQPPAGSAERISRAQGFVQNMVEGKYEAAASGFDPTLLKAMPPEKLKQFWEATLQQCGAFRSIGEARTASEGGYEMVFVPCVFEKATLDLKLVFNRDNTVCGLWALPHLEPAQAQYSLPPYVHQDMFTERDVTVGSGEWQLPGTLAMPKGAGPFPAVVLVHGSGPNDRDESIGANKPFCDLAGGLVGQGIAVLRYDKRTQVYAEKLASFTGAFTVKDEVLDDAHAAIDLLRHTDGIDPQQIFVLGHSLGGMLIPRIGVADPALAGLIIMAGPTRPLEDAILDQVQYLASISGAPKAEVDKQLNDLRAQIAIVNSAELKPETQVLGAPGSYWLDLRDYDLAETAQVLGHPLLILQGGRDYQVTEVDFAGWQQALSGKANVTFKLYPELNHIFSPGEGKSNPNEYNQRGPIPEAVIDDIAGWIKHTGQ